MDRIVSEETILFEVELFRYFHIVSAITLLICSKCYLTAKTTQGQKLFVEIWYVRKFLDDI